MSTLADRTRAYFSNKQGDLLEIYIFVQEEIQRREMEIYTDLCEEDSIGVLELGIFKKVIKGEI